MLLARRSEAKRYGLPVLGVWRSFAVVGVPPRVMGIGPAYAIPEALKKAGRPYMYSETCPKITRLKRPDFVDPQGYRACI